MGNLVVQQFVSADGFAANADNSLTLFDDFDGDSDEFHRSNLQWLDSVGLIVLGKNTYEMFAEYWPTDESAGEAVAEKLNALPKVVFSTTLETAPWGDGKYADVTIESGGPDGLVHAITRLANDYRGDIVVWGSIDLTYGLFEAGLVDEVRIVVLPMVTGAGRSVFPPISGVLRLRLVSNNRFDSGIVELVYAVENLDQSVADSATAQLSRTGR